jgi:hypothetical protein
MPRAAPGPCGRAPLPRGCHAWRRRRGLKPMSGQRAARPDSQPRAHHRRPDSALALAARPTTSHCLASLIPTTPSPSPKPTVAVRAPRLSLSGRLRRREHVHGERRPSSPLVVLHPWSVELTFPSLLTVAGPPPATVAPPRRRNATAELDFFSSPSTRSSGELSSPPPMSGG